MLMNSRPTGAVSNSFLQDFLEIKIQIFSSLLEVDEIQFRIEENVLKHKRKYRKNVSLL